MGKGFLNELKEYLRSSGVNPLPLSDIPEEVAPDLPVATSSTGAIEIMHLEVGTSPEVETIFTFFVDGVQRTVPIGEVIVKEVRVPIHIAHIIAGAMERVNKSMKPYKLRQAIVLLFPYQAMKAYGWDKDSPPLDILDSTGNIYRKAKSKEEDNPEETPIFFSDTSISLRQDQSGRNLILLGPGDLIKTGEVRRKALDRTKELLRIVELGFIWEMRQEKNDSWILLDGPIAPLLKYGRLADSDLLGLEDIANPEIAFDFLHRVIGAVKKVQIVPTAGVEAALNSANFVSPIFQFSSVVEDDDEVARWILSAYIWLRRELSREITILWSTVSGLVRFDIPIPSILDESMRSSWKTIIMDNEKALREYLSSETNRKRLEKLLQAILIERWPVPSSTITRMLTEIFPIAETELWLKANLRDVLELRNLI